MTVMLELGGNGACGGDSLRPRRTLRQLWEGYLTEDAAERVEAIAEELRAAGVELAVREYEAAA
jgi:hypothetical protein